MNLSGHAHCDHRDFVVSLFSLESFRLDHFYSLISPLKRN